MSQQTGTRPPGQGASGAEDTIKDFWASRPHRPRRGRKLAGVAAGVGYRYGVDPVVIRVALVVTTVLGGVGVAAYLLGWLFFPDERDEVSAVESLFGKGRSHMSTVFTVCLCVAAIPVLSWTFAGGWFDGGGLLGVGLLLAALYLLHRARGADNRPSAPHAHRDSGQGGPAPASFTHTEVAHDQADTGATEEGAADPTVTWDPLGAAPLSWDLPEVSKAPEPLPTQRARPPRRRSKAGIATFGLALMVAGAGAALTATGTPWFSVQHVIGLVLGVLGIGLVVAAFAGGGRKLVALAVPLSIIGVILTALPLQNLPGGIGRIEQAPTTIAALRPSYEQGMGNIDIDLTKLPSSSPPIDVSVHVGMGEATVVVPTTADVTFSCSSGVGDVDCLNQTHNGLGNQEIRGTRLGPDGAGGQEITVDVTAGMGSVEVRRG